MQVLVLFILATEIQVRVLTSVVRLKWDLLKTIEELMASDDAIDLKIVCWEIYHSGGGNADQSV